MTDLNVRPHYMQLVVMLTIINYRKQDMNCLLSSDRMNLSRQCTPIYTNNSPISRATRAPKRLRMTLLNTLREEKYFTLFYETREIDSILTI